jgi:hypothetical protein
MVRGTVRYGTVRYGTVRYGTVRYGTVRYDMACICMYALFSTGRRRQAAAVGVWGTCEVVGKAIVVCVMSRLELMYHMCEHNKSCYYGSSFALLCPALPCPAPFSAPCPVRQLAIAPPPWRGSASMGPLCRHIADQPTNQPTNRPTGTHHHHPLPLEGKINLTEIKLS